MSTVNALTNKIQQIVEDRSFTPAIILDFLNQALKEIAGGAYVASLDYISPPLPDLATSYAVNTDTTDAYVALPTAAGSEYHRDVFFVVSTDQSRRIKLFDSFPKFLAKYPVLDDTGSVTAVCVKGQNLYYQGKPSSVEALRVYYHRKPATMALSTDEPEGLPYHLHDSLLVNMVAAEIFSKMEDGVDNRKIQTVYYWEKFQKAMEHLVMFVGSPNSEPVFVDDESVYVDDLTDYDY